MEDKSLDSSSGTYLSNYALTAVLLLRPRNYGLPTALLALGSFLCGLGHQLFGILQDKERALLEYGVGVAMVQTSTFLRAWWRAGLTKRILAFILILQLICIKAFGNTLLRIVALDMIAAVATNAAPHRKLFRMLANAPAVARCFGASEKANWLYHSALIARELL